MSQLDQAPYASEARVVFETLTVREEGAVLFAEIAAPPMNLLGPELVRDLGSLIQRAEADDACQVLVFKSAGGMDREAAAAQCRASDPNARDGLEDYQRN